MQFNLVIETEHNGNVTHKNKTETGSDPITGESGACLPGGVDERDNNVKGPLGGIEFLVFVVRSDASPRKQSGTLANTVTVKRRRHT